MARNYRLTHKERLLHFLSKIHYRNLMLLIFILISEFEVDEYFGHEFGLMYSIVLSVLLFTGQNKIVKD